MNVKGKKSYILGVLFWIQNKIYYLRFITQILREVTFINEGIFELHKNPVHRGESSYINIYIYIYACVCVCVWSMDKVLLQLKPYIIK